MKNSQFDSLTSILHLPDDCLHFIFQRLDSSSDRESFGLTCHRWLHIQNSSRRSLQLCCSLSHFTPISLSQSSTKINSFHLYKLLNRFTQLESLSLSGCTELSDSGFSELAHVWPKLLRSLNLDCCFNIRDHGLSYMASDCPGLVIISLYRCNITNAGLQTLSRSCLALKDVNLSYCGFISDPGIRSLSQNCRHLRAISISHCRNVKGTGLQGCPNSLEYLEADSCSRLSPGGISAAISGGGLKYLNLSNLFWFGSAFGMPGGDTRCISNLRVVNFRLCRTIGDDIIARIAEGCPLLEEWNLALCHGVKVSGWESIGASCRKLERLHVNRCQNLCDRGHQALRNGCPGLRKLYLGSCRQLSLRAVVMFKCLRGDVDIIDDEIMCIAPDWAFRL
ncbi:F-box/LRR-repeat protein 12 [Striga hermonthica]|uniref:F-box/LRR-repeat protein 12 n=1 Tax=Striga hermonthica TaxID=68872 RepID=A0A9N7P2U8_STRHE|nr:F-box/LRR-repeat protein 12 [Striga hermonthica]